MIKINKRGTEKSEKAEAEKSDPTHECIINIKSMTCHVWKHRHAFPAGV